tara:strand:- start:1145 stop:1831 length:687 start_codon:yes stop_codon:yes gene_type:complete
MFILSNEFCNCKNYKVFNYFNFTIQCFLCCNKRVINFENENEIYNLLNNINNSVNLIIHTNGGASELPNFLAYILKQKNLLVKSYIPEKALSAGSFIALSSDIIYMNWYSSMSPIDTQIDYDVSNGEDDVCEESFPAKFIKEVNKKNNAVTKLKAMEANSYHNDDLFLLSRMFKNKKRRKKIINHFLNTELSHSIRYGPKDLKQFGLNIKICIPKDIKVAFDIFKKLL